MSRQYPRGSSSALTARSIALCASAQGSRSRGDSSNQKDDAAFRSHTRLPPTNGEQYAARAREGARGEPLAPGSS